MAIRPLTKDRIREAKPRKEIYAIRVIRDQKLKGFHLRVSPTGGQHFAIEVTRGGSRNYEAVGDADQTSVDNLHLYQLMSIPVSASCSYLPPFTAPHHHDCGL